MKWKIVIPILIAIVSLGAFVYLNGDKAQDTDTASAASESEKLVVSPQEARTSVKIDNATLSQGGFVVIRGSDGKRLGQVIEISQYLEAGEYKNITIVLGDFYTYKPDDQLVAMMYRDDGDRSFNELDQPVDAFAVFVETGAPVPPSVFEEQTASGGTGMVTVRYTNTGFQPAKLTVPTGTMVEFINQSDADMWVASNVHPEHLILPTFDQFKGVKKGESYMYTFEKKGSWQYHDHNNPALEGIITVE